MEETIDFNQRFSKLDCSVGSLFTTFRPDEHAQYYMDLEGKQIGVTIAGEPFCRATLLQVFRGTGNQLSGELLKYNCDGLKDCIDKYGGEYRVLVLIFRKEPDVE